MRTVARRVEPVSIRAVSSQELQLAEPRVAWIRIKDLPYPYAIDPVLARRGKQLFYSKEMRCSRCHGEYDGQGNVKWPGVSTDVGTDRGRRDVVSETQSNSSISPRGEVWAACPARPGTISTAAAAISAPVTATRPATERCSRSGRSTHTAIHGGHAEQREAQLEVDDRAAERGHPEQRHQRADVEHRPQRIVRGREVQVDGNRDQPDHRRDRQRHRHRAQARAGTRLTSGRATSSRSTISPIALITDTNITQRAISSCGVAAVADTFGTGNCGAGPGFGPTA